MHRNCEETQLLTEDGRQKGTTAWRDHLLHRWQVRVGQTWLVDFLRIGRRHFSVNHCSWRWLKSTITWRRNATACQKAVTFRVKPASWKSETISKFDQPWFRRKNKRPQLSSKKIIRLFFTNHKAKLSFQSSQLIWKKNPHYGQNNATLQVIRITTRPDSLWSQ